MEALEQIAHRYDLRGVYAFGSRAGEIAARVRNTDSVEGPRDSDVDLAVQPRETPPSVELTVDHVEPRRLGGDNSSGNLVTACRTCNRDKGGKAAWAWLADRPDERAHFLEHATRMGTAPPDSSDRTLPPRLRQPLLKCPRGPLVAKHIELLYLQPHVRRSAPDPSNRCERGLTNRGERANLKLKQPARQQPARQ